LLFLAEVLRFLALACSNFVAPHEPGYAGEVINFAITGYSPVNGDPVQLLSFDSPVKAQAVTFEVVGLASPINGFTSNTRYVTIWAEDKL